MPSTHLEQNDQTSQTNSPKQTRTKESRLTIGWLTEMETSTLSTHLWAGVNDVARERGINLITVQGHILNSPIGFQAQANVLYNLVGPHNLDGLLIWGGLLSQNISIQAFKTFCAQYHPLPIVNIGMSLENVPNIQTNNYMGMRDAVRHLVKAHNYRRIAFIRGALYQEAEDRYRAYSDVLTEYGLLVRNLITPPTNQQRSDGAAAIELLMDERRVELDAIVAATDALALGATDALRARGAHIPKDVAIVGFDDIEEASAQISPLTTVRQPMYEMSRQATEMLLAMIIGEQVAEHTIVPSELVIRQSCGCLDPMSAQAATGPVAAKDIKFKTALAQQREAIVADIKQSVTIAVGDPATNSAEQLLDALATDLEKETPDTFVSTLDKILIQTMVQGKDVAAWQEAISTLRRHTLPYLIKDHKAWSQAENLWQQGRIVIGRATEQARAQQAFQAQQQADKLRQIGQSLITTANMTELTDTLARELPRLGIPRCYFSLYDKPELPTQWARLTLAYDENGRITLEPERLRFPSRQLAPDDMFQHKERFSLLLEPLFFRDKQLGFVLLETDPRQADIHEPLRTQLSSALHRTILMQQVQDHAIQVQTAAEVSQAASNILDPAQLVQQVIDLARKRFNLYYAGLFLVDESGEWAVLQAGTGNAGQQMVAQGQQLQVGGDSMIGRCVATGQARIAMDVGAEAVRFDNPLLPETRTELALPLISRGQTIGAITIQSVQETAFDTQDIAVFQTLADQLANAIQNAHLFEQTQRALAEVEATHRRYLGHAWMEYSHVTPATDYGTAQQEAESFSEAALPGIRAAMAQKRPVVLNDASTSEAKGAASALAAPITLRDTIIGGLYVHDEDGERQWSDDEIILIQNVAERMATAAENLQLLDNTQHSAARERLIGKITARMRESLDLDVVLQTAIREMGDTLDIAQVSVWMRNKTTIKD